MSDLVDERAAKEGEYIVLNGATVRECAKAFGVGKSTVHSDVTKKLRAVLREDEILLEQRLPAEKGAC